MQLRVARHTQNIEKIKRFYVDLLGLEILGEFQGHDGYDGIFIGQPDKGWHLEFTVSDHLPQRVIDEDDLLIFYTSSEEDYKGILVRAEKLGMGKTVARNPYWNKKGIIFKDPDGYLSVIVK